MHLMSDSIFCFFLITGNEIQSGIGGLFAVEDCGWHQKKIQRIIHFEYFSSPTKIKVYLFSVQYLIQLHDIHKLDLPLLNYSSKQPVDHENQNKFI